MASLREIAQTENPRTDASPTIETRKSPTPKKRRPISFRSTAGRRGVDWFLRYRLHKTIINISVTLALFVGLLIFFLFDLLQMLINRRSVYDSEYVTPSVMVGGPCCHDGWSLLF